MSVHMTRAIAERRWGPIPTTWPPWTCGACGQRNTGWVMTCGRCEEHRLTPVKEHVYWFQGGWWRSRNGKDSFRKGITLNDVRIELRRDPAAHVQIFDGRRLLDADSVRWQR
jgi:hypothetical protein